MATKQEQQRQRLRHAFGELIDVAIGRQLRRCLARLENAIAEADPVAVREVVGSLRAIVAELADGELGRVTDQVVDEVIATITRARAAIAGEVAA